MKRWELSLLALVVLISCSSYALSAPEISKTALAAQAAAPANVSEPAYKLCPSQSATERYSTKVRYPKTYEVFSPTEGKITITSLTGKSCSYRDEKKGTYVRSECVGPQDCRALEYEDEYGVMQPVTNSRYDSTPPVPCVGGGLIITTACGADMPPQPEVTHIPTSPTTQSNEVINAYKPDATAPNNTVPQTNTAPTVNQVGQTVPVAGQTTTGPAPYVPSGNAAAPVIPSSSYTPAGPSQTSPSYSAYPQQATFPSSYSAQPQDVGVRLASNGISSSLASIFFSNLFPASLSPIGSFVQFLFTPSIPVRRPVVTAQSQNPRELVLEDVTIPNSPEVDINKQILAIEKQQEEILRSKNRVEASDETAKVIASATTVGVPDTTTVSSESNGISKPKTRKEIEAAFMKEAATTTESTSTPAQEWHEPDVVEVGVPVDITDPASYESILAYINGDWTHVQRTILQNKTALAQAESERESIIAHIGALREARDAGICDAICDSIYSELQRELPQWQSRIDALETSIRKDASPHPVPPPTVGQISRVAESLTESTYTASISVLPRLSSTPPTRVSVASQETAPVSGEVKGEATVLRIVRSVWDFLKSLFLPSPEAQAPKATCSLFRSLFGGCT